MSAAACPRYVDVRYGICAPIGRSGKISCTCTHAVIANFTSPIKNRVSLVHGQRFSATERCFVNQSLQRLLIRCHFT
jgi:hypothetical protein